MRNKFISIVGLVVLLFVPAFGRERGGKKLIGKMPELMRDLMPSVMDWNAKLMTRIEQKVDQGDE